MSLIIGSSLYGGNSYLVEELRPIINKLGMKLIAIHEHDNADIKWDLYTWKDHLKLVDIIIAPANYKKQPAKSANRLIQAMSLAKPVICSPLPAYLDILKEYPDSFLVADTLSEWEEKLNLLKNDENLRKTLSSRAYEVSKNFSIDKIGKKWEDVLFNTDKVDIIIPTYNNPEILKLCLDSISKCTDIKYTVIVIDNGIEPINPNYIANLKYIKVEKRLTFAEAVNIGLKNSSAPYVCILNDDVIVSKNWLNILVNTLKSNKDIGAIGPLSNCDKGWLHNYDININNVQLLPGSNTIDQIRPIIPELYTFHSPYNEIIQRDWIAFYCTVIPRYVIEVVGELDENFKNTGEDVDYCYRIKKCGYKIYQNYKSFVFHFGAVGRKILEKEDYNLYHKHNQYSTLYLNEKYNKETVVLYSGPSFEKWNFKNLESGIGGSETWQIYLSRELSHLGYRVISFCDCESNIIDPIGNVVYYPYSYFNQFINQNYIDYFISSRTTDPFKLNIKAHKKFCMIHDIWLLSPKEQTFLDKIDKFITLSVWHKKFVSSYHNIPEDKINIIGNGLNFELYNNKVEKIPNRLFYSSSLDRGLDTLLLLFPLIKKYIKNLQLHIFYGFDIWLKSLDYKPSSEKELQLKKIENLKKLMNQDGVIYHGRIGQKKLANEQLKSYLWAYPTDFEETFCITAIESQRAGCPVIASNYAGLQTTVNDSGILIGHGNKGESYTKEFQEQFVEKCIEILEDKEKWGYWVEVGFKNSEKYSWKIIAKTWKQQFSE